MAARAQNLWPFGSGKPTPKTRRAPSSATLGEAYKEGKASGHFSDFWGWIDSKGISRDSGSVKRLKQSFESGVRDRSARSKADDLNRAFLQRTQAKGTEYKGRTIVPAGDAFRVQPGDGSQFDSVKDAKRFIDDEVKMGRNPKKKKAPGAKATARDALRTYDKVYDYTSGLPERALKSALGMKNPTDRALRYRANAEPPAGPKRCAFCGKKSGLIEVGHVDGHEENNNPENKIWTCRSCNVKCANTMRKARIGRLTHQYNPEKGATSVGQWLTAVMSMKGESNAMSVKDAVEMIRATPASRRSRFAEEIWSRRKAGGQEASDRRNPMRKRICRNPEEDAAQMYEKFHGKPSTGEVAVEEQVHEHEHLATLGVLINMVVATLSGFEATIGLPEKEAAKLSFDESTADPDAMYLATNEEGTQLYIVGGDQSLDLSALKMADFERDDMVVGQLLELTYRTKKKFDAFKLVDYYHELGEETGDLPLLRYEPRSEHLYISGGKYQIKMPLVGMSPGIEN